MSKSYSGFSIEEILQRFDLTQHISSLFSAIEPIEASLFLKESLEIGLRYPLLTEKASSERIISPILLEVSRRNDNKITLFSGVTLKADNTKGLTGECDFLLSKQEPSYSIQSPIIALVEAKKGDIELGIGQCVAQMLGAQLFNSDKGRTVPVIFGCVTSGKDWLFMKLENQSIHIDNQVYYLNDLPHILGIFQHIIDLNE
jgi:hypothetical protein